MKYYCVFFLLLVFLFGCDSIKKEPEKQVGKVEKVKEELTKTNDFALVIHGGAGVILRKNLTELQEVKIRKKLQEAAETGYEILKNGGTSLDAVEQTINILENSPLFNAGKGAVFTHDKKNDLDASIMDGNTLDAGAVAGVQTVKNPISAARKVMENSPHVMLSGIGADEFAKEQGLQIVHPRYFFTRNRYESLLKVQQEENVKATTSLFYDETIKNSKYGTVGCVALDKKGNIAAGTSTGGMTNKRWNRIGDSPIIGAGTYANNKTCGVSSTGWGEYFIRLGVAKDISAMMEYGGSTLREAAKEVIQNKLTNLGGTGGIIALDKYGNIVMEFNTPGMYRASINDRGQSEVKIFKNY